MSAPAPYLGTKISEQGALCQPSKAEFKFISGRRRRTLYLSLTLFNVGVISKSEPYDYPAFLTGARSEGTQMPGDTRLRRELPSA